MCPSTEMNQSIASEFNYIYDSTKYAKTPLEIKIDLFDADNALKDSDLITPQGNLEPSKMLKCNTHMTKNTGHMSNKSGLQGDVSNKTDLLGNITDLNQYSALLQNSGSNLTSKFCPSLLKSEQFEKEATHSGTPTHVEGF